MATLAELIAQRDSLSEIRTTGVKETSYNDKSVTYRSDKEIASAIAEVDRQIAVLSKKPVRRILVGTTKGF